MDITLKKDYSIFKKGKTILNMDNAAACQIIREGNAREATLEEIALNSPSTEKKQTAKAAAPKKVAAPAGETVEKKPRKTRNKA